MACLFIYSIVHGVENTQARDIGSSLAAAVGSIVDLKFVRSVVDIALDKLNENERRGRAATQEDKQHQVGD